MARRFEFEEGGSSKFWEVSVDGSDMTVTYGRIGTTGQTKTKSFATNEAAQKEADKLVAEKTKKGYQEVGGDAPPAAAASKPAGPPPKPTAATPVSSATSAASSGAGAKGEEAEAIAALEAAENDAAAGPTIEIDGEPVRFSVPAWVAEEAEVPLSRPLAKKRALSFEKVWEDLFKQHAGWSAGSHHSYRWQVDHPQATPFARELATRTKQRLDDKKMGDGFDVDLEAATFALIGFSYYQAEDRPSRVLWHWAERVGPELAIQAFLRAKHIQPFTGGGEEKWPKPIFFVVIDSLPNTYAVIHHRELSALRELARAYGREPVEKELRAAVGPNPSVLDQAALAWLFDDEARAKELVAKALVEANLAQLGLLVPFVDNIDAIEKILPSLYQDGPDGGSLVRTAMRLGLPFAKLAFARVPAEPHHARRWAPVLACYPSIHAARLLVPMLENKTNRKLVSEALSAMPAHATKALTEALKKKPKYRDAIDSLLATFSASAKAEAAGGEEDVGEEAPADAIPKVLATPPWRAKKKAAKEAVFEGLVARDIERAVDLSAVEPRTLASYRQRLAYYKHYTAKTIRDAIASRARADASYTLGLSLEDLTALHAEGVMATLSSPWWQADSYTPGLALILDQHGVGAIDPLVAMAPNLKTNLSAELEYAGASSIAPLAITWLGAKGSRSAAFAWVKRFPKHAAAGLVPIVVDKPGTSRDRAMLLLAALVRAGHREIVLEEAAHHGSEVRDAIQVLLDRDPIELVPAKIPKVQDGLENLPRPKLKDGRVLSREATNVLLEALAFSPIDPPYVGVEQVKEACDPRSLDAFVEALVRAWVAGGMVTAHEWCVRAVALVGSDKAARFLFDRGRAWALDNSKQRAILALDVLGAMGTDLALSLVGRVSRSGARQYMKDRAVEILAEIAAARGLSADELEDRTAPDLGLDENGTMVFDFGPRAFRVGFDEHLRPFVQSADGTEKLDSFPRAAKTDDAEKAKAASEAWKHLKSEAEKVSRDQIARLERMMGEERRVDADVFVDAFVKHPLVGHLVKRLVWGAFDTGGALLGTFRVAEDRTYATVEDDTYELPEGARVGVVHPYTLKDTPGLVARWGQQLSDYAIAQPFGQLTRPLVELTPAMLTSRYTDKQAPTGLLFGLRSFGWRTIVQEYGDIEGFERNVNGARVVVSMDPWLRQGESKVHKIKVYAYTTSDQPMPSPVQISELVFQLDGVLV
jgi:predicted DNA-binding WGR domain protein